MQNAAETPGAEASRKTKNMSEKISLKPKQPDALQDGDGFKIIMPEVSQPIPMPVDDFGDVQEVHFGKIPINEVFAKQPAKKRIRQVEKAKAKTKRRKQNKAAKQSRKK